jgi:hypothetical protein
VHGRYSDADRLRPVAAIGEGSSSEALIAVRSDLV